MSQEPIKLIKCLYNTSSHSNILRFSDKCLYEKYFDDEFKKVFANKSYITFYEKNN